MTIETTDVLVLGGGPAGVFAALRAAELGARTRLVTSGAFGGMAANDGPVPVRTLAHAARLMREAGQLPLYGIRAGAPKLDYAALLGRVTEVVGEVGAHSTLRAELDQAGVVVHERAGRCRFVGPRLLECPSGRRFEADRIILCTGGAARRLDVPGSELVATHSDAWGLAAIPASMLVIGGGATGLQVASIFAAFGARVTLFESGPRLLCTEDEDFGIAVAQGFRARGIEICEAFGEILRFEKAGDGVRMHLRSAGGERVADGALAVAAIGWRVDAEALGLDAAGVETDARGYVRVDGQMRTSAPNIFAAGDATGVAMLVPQALQQGFVAASAALGAPQPATGHDLVTIGSFTDPEYARVGMTETEARRRSDPASVTVPFESATRPIIDGRTFGFCKLIADRASRHILGCSVVGDRAVDIVQVAAVAMAADMPVDRLAHFPLSFPTYAGLLSQAAARLSYRLNHGA